LGDPNEPGAPNVIIEQDAEGCSVASVPSLPGCHTQAKSLDELMQGIREVFELCVEVEGDDSSPLDFVGVQKITLGS
jgi:predicted RNase H-like HicB family nuclease